jgi:hypothetical protein
VLVNDLGIQPEESALLDGGLSLLNGIIAAEGLRLD